jgi:hypothetical protein
VNCTSCIGVAFSLPQSPNLRTQVGHLARSDFAAASRSITRPDQCLLAIEKSRNEANCRHPARSTARVGYVGSTSEGDLRFKAVARVATCGTDTPNRSGATLRECKMSVENLLWGAPRIHGDLLKLGFVVAQSTVARYMAGNGGPRGQSWGTFCGHRSVRGPGHQLRPALCIGYCPIGPKRACVDQRDRTPNGRMDCAANLLKLSPGVPHSSFATVNRPRSACRECLCLPFWLPVLVDAFEASIMFATS